MNKEPIVIIGLGSAGFAAYKTLRTLMPKTEMVIIATRGEEIVHPCGLPYALEGQANLEEIQQKVTLAGKNVAVLTGRAKDIDTSNHRVSVTTESGSQWVAYDTLLIATGSVPAIPPIDGLDAIPDELLFSVHSPEETARVSKFLETQPAMAVIGGGAIGIEAAHAAHKRGARVHLFEGAPSLLPRQLDADMSKVLEEYYSEKGITLHTGTMVKALSMKGSEIVIHTADKEISVQGLLLASGFSPATDFLQSSGIEYDHTGVTVTPEMATSAPDVYAAGDVVTSWSLIDGKPLRSPLAPSAWQQGRVAGRNMAGLNTSWPGTTSSFVSVTGDMEIAACGLSSQVAKERGFSPVAGKVHLPELPHYMGPSAQCSVKILLHSDGTLLGAQALGQGAGSVIDRVTLAMHHDSTTLLSDVEHAYCPARNEVEDALMKAMDIAIRKTSRKGKNHE